jgi:hypothetical protein
VGKRRARAATPGITLDTGALTMYTQVDRIVACLKGLATDSVASIGGALAAAMFPHSVDEKWYQAVENVNDHNLVDLAVKLAALRE